jgi:hypothetical protein
MKVPTNPVKATIQLRIVKGGYDFSLDWICCNRISSGRNWVLLNRTDHGSGN